MAQLPGRGPLAEPDLADQPGLDPVHPRHRTRQLAALERGTWPFDGGQPVVQAAQHLVGEAGADLTRVEQPSAGVVVAEQQRAEPDPRALRVGEAADDELLAALALELQPVL